LQKVDEEGRLSIPIDALRAVEWWKSASVDVIAELVRPRLIRVYLANEAQPLIDSLLHEISERPAPANSDATAIVVDRYRTLKLYADGRLRFTKEVCALLAFQLGEHSTLFVQPFRKHLEAMTLEFRAQRLIQTSPSTSITVSGS
jgi:hypothetical protein